jgi:hypothetical protein
MSLIRDNDDERRARVEALICELLNAHTRTPAQRDESRRPITYGENLDRTSKAKGASRSAG